MAVNYLYKAYKDVHTLTNNDTEDINYTLYRASSSGLVTVSQGTVAVGETFTLPLNRIDGEYTLSMVKGTEQAPIIVINYHLNLFYTLISKMESILCDCGCENCSEEEICGQISSAIAFSQSYFTLNRDKYELALSLVEERMNIQLSDKISDLLKQTFIKGKGDSSKSLIQLLGMYYIAFLSGDLATAADDSETAYIKSKYNLDMMLTCLKDKGIVANFGAGSSSITGGMQVFYWQLDNTTDNIDTVKPLLTNAFLASKPSSLYPVFNGIDGKIVNYLSMGRICFAIKRTNPLNYKILDQINSDVTEFFDTFYDAELSAYLFVSKLNYSYGSIKWRIIVSNGEEASIDLGIFDEIFDELFD